MSEPLIDNLNLIIKLQTTEIERLRSESDMWKKSFGDLDRKVQCSLYPEIERLKTLVVPKLANAVKAMAEELNWDYEQLLHQSREATKDADSTP